MKTRTTIFALLLFPALLAAQSEPNYERAALDLFLSTYWNSHLFDGECTGLAFDPSFAIRVNNENPVYTIDTALLRAHLPLPPALAGKAGVLRDIPYRLPLPESRVELKRTSLRAAPAEIEGLATLEREREFIEVRKVFNAYFLRFSSRLLIGDRVFVDLWIKTGYATSGAHLLVEMDQAARVLRHVRYTRCEDEG